MGSVVRLVLAEWFSPLRPRPSFEPARRVCALARSRADHSSCAVATPNRRGANSEYKKLSTENRKIVLPAIAPKRDRHPTPETGVAHALLCLTRFSAMLY
jgi:hypothetical protein